MRTSVLIALFFAVAAFPVLASSKKFTDAEAAGFKGAVKSVSTERQVVMTPYPRQPDGPTIIYPVGCILCDYDEDGNLVRLGQNSQTGFIGETTHYVRDESGNVKQKIDENEKGEPVEKVVMGPFGRIEEEFYQHGTLQSRKKYRYDENGNVIEGVTYDAHGVQIARYTATFDEHGTVTEEFDYGPKNKFLLHYTQTYDPETDVQTFSNFNDDGTVRLTFMTKGDRVTSYWQQPSNVTELGSTVCFKTACVSHNLDGSAFRTVRTLTDGDGWNPRRIELRDDKDQPQMAADYEYEFDGRGNWTKRSVWIWTPESGERKLLEIDSRTLSYWK